MKIIGRIVLILIALLIILGIVGGVAFAIVARRPFPQTDGVLQVAGLQGEVHVLRDDYGIPHIYAQNADDLFFAQGYVHAQDRFWQMEFWRHVGLGRISEIVGEAGLDNDRFIRTIGWNRMAEDTLAMYEKEEPEFMAIMEAYSAGVNAYIETHRDRLSLNYTILSLANEPWEIEPWTPLHTVAWGTVMAWDLSGNWGDELRRASLISALGEATTEALLPGYPANRPIIAPSELLEEQEESSFHLSPLVDWPNVNTTLIGAAPDLGLGRGLGDLVGSNNWVVSGDHTDTGMPLLANDPHLGIQMPSIWYENGLHAPGWDVVGFSFAGVPAVVIGHNENIAWGVTNVGPDTQDLYIEKTNPSNSLQYEYQGEWEDMEVVNEVIKVNGGEDVTLEVRLTRHGPIINEVEEGLKDQLAFQWAAATPSRLLRSVVMLNQAENYEAFREALQYWDTAAQNVVYADTEGNIAYQMPGRIPIRQNGNGLTPVPGWTGEYEWEGWIPYEELPRLFNPEQGYIVTANNAVVDEEYPYLISLEWADGNRAQRITEMIEEAIAGGGQITADDFARIHFDSQSLIAADYVPLLEGLSSDDAQAQAALERLRGWDLQLRRDSVPAALFEIFYMNLGRAVLADELGEAAEDYLGNGGSQRILFHSLAGQPNARWWDDTTTEGQESREEMLLKALTDTVAWFEDNVGGDMNEWTWGAIHTATFVSSPLGQSGIGPLESIVNRGPFPADGGSSIVNALGWSWSEPAVVRGHPSMRVIMDVSNFDASQAIHPTGQSGHPYHAHYDDMIDLWLNGRYHPMLFTREAVDGAAVDHLTLTP
ncbi:MAG: penicillin acylase family protein [Chloroflexota bacterium]